MKVEPATPTDVPSWMEIVRQVETLFGPMPDFEQVLARNIARGTALIVRDDDGSVIAGALMSVKQDGCAIGWLAVRAASRRAGVGRALLEAALEAMPGSADVTVDTFGANNPAGEPARRLYAGSGFVLGELLAPGSDGSSRERWLLKRLPSGVPPDP